MQSSRNHMRWQDVDIFPFLTSLFLVLTFAIKVFTDGPYLRGELSTTIVYSKYITAAISCFFGLAYTVKSGGKIFLKEFNHLIVCIMIFVATSVALQAFTQHVSSYVYVELIKLAMPVLLAYFTLNSLSSDQLYRCMIIILVLSFTAYLVDLANEGTSILAIFNSDFSSSTSDTEHSGLSGISLVLSLYFLYFNRQKWPIVLSTIFCLLTFKRLAMLVVIMGCVIATIAPRLKHKQLPKGWILFSKIATVALVGAWFWLLLPGQEGLFVNIFDSTPFEFTSGRSNIMRWLMDTGFVSYGFGSANDVTKTVFGVPFEMDFIKIAFELSPVLMCLFISVFWNVAGSTFWSYFIIAYYVFNMITSDSLASNFSFTLAYIVIGLISYEGYYDQRDSSRLASKQMECPDVHH